MKIERILANGTILNLLSTNKAKGILRSVVRRIIK